MSRKTLLYCWVAQNLCVLVPKKRGEGYLKMPYGHHHNMALTDIANDARDDAHVDVMGLDGALEFECGGRIFHGGEVVRKEFSSKVIPRLEEHYGYASREIHETEFWEKHPLTAGSTIGSYLRGADEALVKRGPC